MKQITFILFLIVSITAFSQQPTQNIKGKVIDKQSEFPLMGAEIITHVNNQDYWAVTNENGEFIIENVPIGKLDIQAHYNGFAPQTISQVRLISGKELILNFSLLEKLEGLDEVVIKAKAKRDNVAFVSASSASFNVQQTNQYAGSLNDVSRMAMNYAGVSGNDDTRNDIIVRGNNPASLLWVVEGNSVPSPNHYSASGSSGGPVSMLNINALKRSDFLSGAFPANYGNTTSGVFDLSFRKPNKDKTEFVGQIGFAGLELGIEGPFSKKTDASYLLNYRYSTLEIFDKLGLNLGTGSAIPKYQDINTVVNIPTENAGNFKFWAIGGVSAITFDKSEATDDNDNYFIDQNTILSKRNNNIISGLTHNYFFNKNTSSKVSISYSSIDDLVKIDTLSTDDSKYYRKTENTIITNFATIDAKINSKINAKNKLSGGLAYTSYGIDFTLDVKNTYHSEIDKNTGLASAYINWQHRFTDDLVLNSGLRYQYHTLNNQGAIEPRLGLKYQAFDKTSISLAYGLHSTLNPLLSYFTKQEVSPLNYKFANEDVSFLKAHHLVFGVQQKLGDFLNVKAEAYYQYLFDVPISHKNPVYSIINSGYNDPNGSQLFYDELFNEGKGKNYGLDLTLEYPIKNGFYALVTGSLYESKYTGYDAIWRNTAWNGNYMASLLTGKEIKLGKKSSIGLDINLNFAGGRRFTPIDKTASALAGEAVYITAKTFEAKLPDYFRTDVKLSFKLNGKKINQEWQLDFRNLSNRKNIFSQSYNSITNKITTHYQQGILPVMQYRILF